MRIELTKGYYTEIDDEDFDKVKGHSWYVRIGKNSDNKYAETKSDKTNNKSILMHRLLMNNPIGFVVDHIDGNGLNNKRDNLRVATKSQNSQNKKVRKDSASQYKGVYFNKNKIERPYSASIKCKENARRIGYYDSAQEAAFAYDIEARECFKEFANLNFPFLVDKPFINDYISFDFFFNIDNNIQLQKKLNHSTKELVNKTKELINSINKTVQEIIQVNNKEKLEFKKLTFKKDENILSSNEEKELISETN